MVVLRCPFLRWYEKASEPHSYIRRNHKEGSFWVTPATYAHPCYQLGIVGGEEREEEEEKEEEEGWLECGL